MNVDQAPPRRLAVLLTGGGARAAYQVGVLRGLARLLPRLEIPILTGVSAGGINAASLAASTETFADAVDRLSDLWLSLRPDRVFRVDPWSLGGGALRWALRLVSGGSQLSPRPRGLLDTSPLRRLLASALPARDGEIVGIADNLAAGRLRAVALSTVDYGTGRTVIWIQGHETEAWERPNRRSIETRLGIDHVMASSALPMLFPAVHLDGSWFGDGGVRLTSPLSPAIHLGARRILAISTRYRRSDAEAGNVDVDGYPPPAQVAGVLLNAIFLDLLDQDSLHLERMNRLIDRLGPGEREGLRHVDLVILRPSVDLGRLATEFESRMPRGLRFLTRGLGTRETRSSDLLSLLLFQPDYLKRLIEIGEADVAAERDSLLALLAPPPEGVAALEGR